MERSKTSQASRISSYTKRKKNSVMCRAQDSNLGPLVYEASVLPTELSFRMKNWEQIMTMYIWFVVQQLYVSLTYHFNIVRHTLSHIVEHRKLGSLATPDNIVWSTVTSCWTNNVRQFDPSLSLETIPKEWNGTSYVYHFNIYTSKPVSNNVVRFYSTEVI